MIRIEDCKELAGVLGCLFPRQAAYICLPIPEGPGEPEVEAAMASVRAAGYFCYVRTTEQGDEIVVSEDLREKREPDSR